jgi:hypothetical protein
MRHTNLEFLTILTPGVVRFDAPIAEASLVVVDQTPYAIYVNVPTYYSNPTYSNPTKELFDRITELRAKYLTAWLPNSKAPNETAFQNARDFVLTLPLNRIVKPAIHVASDGEVNFQWSGPDFQIDLGFYGNGKFSFYAAKEGYEPIIGDEVSVKEGIPKSLVDFASGV